MGMISKQMSKVPSVLAMSDLITMINIWLTKSKSLALTIHFMSDASAAITRCTTRPSSVLVSSSAIHMSTHIDSVVATERMVDAYLKSGLGLNTALFARELSSQSWDNFTCQRVEQATVIEITSILQAITF